MKRFQSVEAKVRNGGVPVSVSNMHKFRCLKIQFRKALAVTMAKRKTKTCKTNLFVSIQLKVLMSSLQFKWKDTTQKQY